MTMSMNYESTSDDGGGNDNDGDEYVDTLSADESPTCRQGTQGASSSICLGRMRRDRAGVPMYAMMYIPLLGEPCSRSNQIIG